MTVYHRRNILHLQSQLKNLKKNYITYVYQVNTSYALIGKTLYEKHVNESYSIKNNYDLLESKVSVILGEHKSFTRFQAKTEKLKFTLKVQHLRIHVSTIIMYDILSSVWQ